MEILACITACGAFWVTCIRCALLALVGGACNIVYVFHGFLPILACGRMLFGCKGMSVLSASHIMIAAPAALLTGLST